MAVPQKYREIGDFHDYYSGARKAPYTTIFVGGNHEASSHLRELHYGGWVAPNIYYLGAANVVRFGDLRLAGLSGIWKGYNYNKSHFERLPYSADEIRSLYHVREIDVRKLLLLRTPVDVGISHDWPRGVEWHGNWKALFRKKQDFEQESRAGTLGSAAARYLLDRLRPPYWFSAHMHSKFAATVEHGKEARRGSHSNQLVNDGENPQTSGIANSDQIATNLNNDTTNRPAPVKNEAEIDLDLDDEESGNQPISAATTTNNTVASGLVPDSPTISSDLRSQLPASFTRIETAMTSKSKVSPPPPPAIINLHTRFLALDKCLPNRKFLQILDINPLHPSPHQKPPRISYDKEWLAILRVFAAHDPHQPNPTDLGEAAYMPLIAKEEEWVEANMVNQGKMEVPENFEITAPIYDGKAIGSVGREQPPEYTNPQTKAFCETLEIPNWFDASAEEREGIRKSKAATIDEDNRNGSERGRGRGAGRGAGRGRGGTRGRGRGRGFR